MRTFSSRRKVSVKVSLHTQTAGDTSSHNDRSMYDYAYDLRDRNLHWDCYGIGFLSDENPGGSASPSVDAEKRFYDEHFSGILAKQNENATRKGNYARVKTMDQYRLAHMPRETIVQLGDRDSNLPKELQDVFLIESARKMKEQLESVGCHVISYDIHNDETEGTPHLHIRWIGIDKSGKPNLAGCLREHGIEKADARFESDEEVESYNSRAKKKVKLGDRKPAKYCTELATVTNDQRVMVESFADELLADYNERSSSLTSYERDAERVRGAFHLTTPEFKRKRRAEELEEDLEAWEGELTDRESEVQQQLEQANAVRVAAERQQEELLRQQEQLDERLEEFERDRKELDERLSKFEGYSVDDVIKATFKAVEKHSHESDMNSSFYSVRAENYRNKVSNDSPDVLLNAWHKLRTWFQIKTMSGFTNLQLVISDVREQLGLPGELADAAELQAVHAAGRENVRKVNASLSLQQQRSSGGRSRGNGYGR